MSSNHNNRNVTFISTIADLEPPPGAMTDPGAPVPGNDNATPGGIPDTTPLVASPEVVRHLRVMLRRYGVATQDLADAIADVQADSIEAARTGRMPASAAQWKALAATIAARWASRRRSEAKVRGKYDAGLCDDPDAYARPTLHWETRDPVDTKRYLAVLGELFESGQMPEHGAEILWGEAEEVPHAEIAAELGVTQSVVNNRLYRMRRTFRARLAALGLLTLLLLLVAVLAAPVGGVSAPAPREEPTETAAPVRSVPASDAGTPHDSGNSSSPVRENRAVAH
jgi:DNA-directed RNA polymerase specialized sigma24 family protein